MIYQVKIIQVPSMLRDNPLNIHIGPVDIHVSTTLTSFTRQHIRPNHFYTAYNIWVSIMQYKDYKVTL